MRENVHQRGSSDWYEYIYILKFKAKKVATTFVS